MFSWPKLELTSYERQFVRPYKTASHPGVLRRTYQRTVSHTADVPGFEGIGPSAAIQISRRSRVFALSFTGAVSMTRLQMTNASGTLYNVPDSRTNQYPVVSSMVGGNPAMVGALVGPDGDPGLQGPNNAPTSPTTMYSSQEHRPLLIDPNWVLTPNETLIFNGSWEDGIADSAALLLNITVHVWEFPGMGHADKAVREIL